LDSSAIDISSRIASSATLALKSGEWFFRFVIWDHFFRHAIHLNNWSENPRPPLSNRTQLISQIQKLVESAVNDWGIEVTRAELLDVNLDQATRDAMLQQLNAERARRAQVTEAEGAKRAVELGADAELYAAEQIAKARRIAADAEAYATGVVAAAIADNGMAAAQYQVALKQVEALTALGSSAGSQTVVVPSSAMDAFGDAFKMLKGVSK
jgi:regulator of protease activity HflC (stomatin/prohibitin superfamily)